MVSDCWERMMGRSNSDFLPAQRKLAFVVLSIFVIFTNAANAAKPYTIALYSQGLSLATLPPLLLPYHNGPVLSGKSIDLYLIFYGGFTNSQREIVLDFLNSFRSVSGADAHAVSSWWKTTTGYKDAFGSGVSASVNLAKQMTDATYSLGKTLKVADIEALVKHAVHLKVFPTSPKAIYMVLTSKDVYVDGFCMNTCGFHAYAFPSPATEDKMLPYAWVGNSETQCPGQCAWPFATPHFGPQAPPLRPPNGDVGMDGMIINIATVLAGAATNPYDTGYYQGDAAAPLESVSACVGIFGKGAYPGYPGELMVHNKTGSSFNARGNGDRRFLIPAMWNPASLNCVPL
eukprot:c38789_g1_i1 orf=152-1186(+)